jgi:HSP20 family molecular chaperone IbpA
MITSYTTTWDDLFDEILSPKNSIHKTKSSERDLVLKEDKTFHIHVPGCSENDVDVELEERYMKVKAEANVDNFDFKIEKSYILPTNVDKSKITASVKDGLLTIEMKIKKDKVKVKKLL